MIFFII